MVGAQGNSLFLADRDFERERGNQPIGACLLLQLSIIFFSSLLIFPFLIFFFFFLFFLILVFYFLVFKFLCRGVGSCFLYMARASFYSVCRDRILLF